jgi:predicted ferric reductase
MGSLSNCFGSTALLALSVLLIPVAAHSPLLKLLQWSPVMAVRLHQWSGRAVMVCAAIHGAMHLYRWYTLEHLNLVHQIWPSTSCWSSTIPALFGPAAAAEDPTCYAQLRNLTGILAFLGLGTIAVTSLEPIRRTCFVLFYTSHLLAAPLVFVCVILHWNRSILYLSGGLLYYLATTLVVYFESSQWSTLKNDGSGTGGVRIVSVEHIPCEHDSCISLTVHADACAMERYRPGQYIKLLAPEISLISHPFTINRCPPAITSTSHNDTDNNDHRMRVIFRQTGPFTKQLGTRLLLLLNHETDVVPKLTLDGFHGPSNRLQLALQQHDVVVFVAGGIGITPYLTLLHQMYHHLAAAATTSSSSSPSGETPYYKTRRIVLHWICRDPALVSYITREYFLPLLQYDDENDNESINLTAANNATNFHIQIIIHQTNKTKQQRPTSYTDLEQGGKESFITSPQTVSNKGGIPFRPSKFAAGSKRTLLANLPLLTSFVLIGWIGLMIIWKCYAQLQDNAQLASRSYSILILLLTLPTSAIMINALFSPKWEDDVEGIIPSCCVRASYSPLPSVVKDDDDDDMDKSKIATVAMVATQESPKTTRTTTARVTMEKRECGHERPRLFHFIDVLLDHGHSQRPALFASGPSRLLVDLRETVWQRNLVRLQQRRGNVTGESSSSSPSIAYYEESFEM